MKHKIIAILSGSLMAILTLVLLSGRKDSIPQVDKSQFKYSLNSCLEVGADKLMVLDYDAPNVYVLIKVSDYLSEKTISEDQLIKKTIPEVQNPSITVTACK